MENDRRKSFKCRFYYRNNQSPVEAGVRKHIKSCAQVDQIRRIIRIFVNTGSVEGAPYNRVRNRANI